MSDPMCILCWCRKRANVPAVMFDGIAWYCDEHGDEVVITDRLRPRWIRRLRRICQVTGDE